MVGTIRWYLNYSGQPAKRLLKPAAGNLALHIGAGLLQACEWIVQLTSAVTQDLASTRASPTSVAEPKPLFAYINCIRGYAVLLVITCHLTYEFGNLPYPVHRLTVTG
ncbi:MAG TPA: hypothetical protein VND19_24545 [Acetobacteraceae bacterium]|nr:hypothetical protein [Acetobacteraceae bacterium]